MYIDETGLAKASETLKGYVDNEISKVNDELGDKQDTLTFDTTPTTNSNNPVTSGGVKSYVDNIVGDIEALLGGI